MKLKPIDENTDLALRDADARPPKGAPKDDALKEALEKATDRIGDLQATLYADARYAVLHTEPQQLDGDEGQYRLQVAVGHWAISCPHYSRAHASSSGIHRRRRMMRFVPSSITVFARPPGCSIQRSWGTVVCATKQRSLE